MDADVTEDTRVFQRRLTRLRHVPPLPVGASLNDSDGVITTLFVRRYSTAYNLGDSEVPLTARTKVTNSPPYSGYLYVQYVGTFKGLHTVYLYGKGGQNVQSVTVAVLIVSTVELH